MKHMKKAISLMLILFLTLTMGFPAFAAGEQELGSITINGVSTDNTYEIYKLLDLESYKNVVDPDTGINKGVYSYKVNAAWAAFFSSADVAQYFSVDTQNYATWVGGDNEDTVAAFAKLALEYAKSNNIAPVKSSENTGEFVITTTDSKTKGVFSDLELGYYLIDSTMGALCGLTTTNPNASINAKNAAPTIDKQVKEDSTGQWGGQNTADIGQIVEFRTTINVHAGAENYVLHDKMSAGLTFKGVSHIEHVIPDVETHTLTLNDHYTLDTATDGCTFEIKFSKDFCNHLETNDKVIVYYTAMVNRNAIVANDGNPNEAWLDFGEDHETTHDTTKTYTFGFDLIKTDDQNTLIDGAEFKIYDAAKDGNEVGVVLMDDGVTYRRARPDEQQEGKTVPIVVKGGKVRVVGFDNGTYYLEETVSPVGYNKLAERQKFIISDKNLDSVFNDGIYSTGSGVHVVNKAGTMLPETGGMGTVMFITCGMFVVLATGVLLVTKKRMSMIQG